MQNVKNQRSENSLLRHNHVAADALEVINSGSEVWPGADQVDCLDAFQLAQLDDRLSNHAVGGVLYDDIAGFERHEVLEHAVTGFDVRIVRQMRL